MSLKPEADQTAVGRDPEVIGIHREVVDGTGKIAIAEGAERRRVQAGEAHPTIARHPETRPVRREATQAAEQRREVGAERPAAGPRIAPEKAIAA